MPRPRKAAVTTHTNPRLRRHASGTPPDLPGIAGLPGATTGGGAPRLTMARGHLHAHGPVASAPTSTVDGRHTRGIGRQCAALRAECPEEPPASTMATERKGSTAGDRLVGRRRRRLEIEPDAGGGAVREPDSELAGDSEVRSAPPRLAGWMNTCGATGPSSERRRAVLSERVNPEEGIVYVCQAARGGIDDVRCEAACRPAPIAEAHPRGHDLDCAAGGG